jgi:serine/threonine protein kinase
VDRPAARASESVARGGVGQMTDQHSPKSCPQCGASLPERASLCQDCGFNLVKGSGGASHVGRMLGNLRLTRVIGEGGMGMIYLGEHNALGTQYAVKLLHKSMSRDQVFAERFRREAMACSRLRHPNIVYVTDFGKHPEMGLYLVMEFLEGEDLCTYQQKVRRLELWRAVEVASQTCDALQMAHSAGIVHRDLKPENIFLTRDYSGKLMVKLLDFGVARVKTANDTKLTMQGIAVGTPYYMSPEQATGQSEKTTAASDLYALGAIVHELITGVPLFQADSPFKIMTMHLREVPAPVSRWRPELAGTRLEALLLELLAKAPENRPASASVARQRLQEALRELQDRGIEDAFEPYDPGEVEAPGVSVQGERLSGIVKQLVPPPQGARLGSALKHLAGLPALDDELLFWMAWGVLTRDLLDAAPGSARFTQGLKGAGLFLEHILNTTEPEHAMDVQARLAVGLRDLLQLADKGRRQPLVAMLQPMMPHPLFPTGDLPSWALPEINGSWSSVRSLLNTPVMDFFRKPAEEGGDPAPVVEPPSQDGERSLGDKLRQDISLDSVKSILTHEIRLFRRKGN